MTFHGITNFDGGQFYCRILYIDTTKQCFQKGVLLLEICALSFIGLQNEIKLCISLSTLYFVKAISFKIEVGKAFPQTFTDYCYAAFQKVNKTAQDMS